MVIEKYDLHLIDFLFILLTFIIFTTNLMVYIIKSFLFISIVL